MPVQLICFPLKCLLVLGLIFYSIFTFSMIPNDSPIARIDIMNKENPYKTTVIDPIVYIITNLKQVIHLPINDDNDSVSMKFEAENISLSVSKAFVVTEETFYDDGSFTVRYDKILNDDSNVIDPGYVLNIKINQRLTIFKSGKYNIETINNVNYRSKILKKISEWYDIYIVNDK